ncbi:MAG TPA: STAS domain-containing protein [Enhygromyxa sp.]|nr:STAS domain-containing protein [Enhygromyxa sp.]
MQIPDLDARLRRLTDTLSHLLDGEFDAIDEYGQAADDPLGRIEETVQFLIMDIKTIAMANREKEASLLMQQEQLQAKAETIERQAASIAQLSTPILEIWDDVIVLPIIGVIDTRRSIAIMSALLDSIARTGAKWAIIDITGVEVVDTSTGEYLIRVVRAAGLLGVSCLLSGIQPAVAQTLVGIGAELSEIVTKRNLRSALEHCLTRVARTHAA